MRVSMRSYMIGLLGFGAVAMLRTVTVLGIGSNTSTLYTEVGQTAIAVVAATIILVLASRVHDRADRRVWQLLGFGTLLFAAGEAAWTVLEFRTGAVPYPGIPDVFYLLSYLLTACAVIYAIYTLRYTGEIPCCALISGLTCVVGLAIVFFGLVVPLMSAGLSPLELALSVIYPVVDVVFLVTPAMFLLLVAIRSGDARVIAPWAMVALSLTLYALSDAAFVWMTAYDRYVAGSIIDYGWRFAQVALAVGCSLALDAQLAPSPFAIRIGRARPYEANTVSGSTATEPAGSK